MKPSHLFLASLRSYTSAVCLVVAVLSLDWSSAAVEPAAPDPAFQADLADGLNVSSIRSLAVQADGRIVIAGSLWSPEGFIEPNVRRLHPDGGVDETFRPAFLGDAQVEVVAIQRDQRVLLSGRFQWNRGGALRANLVRVDPQGTPDESFDPGSDVPNGIRAIEEQPDGRLLVAGSFRDFGGTGRHGLVRLNPDGRLDDTFANLPWETALIDSVSLDGDGRVLIQGMISLQAPWVRSTVVRLRRDGQVDNAFVIPDLWVDSEASALQPDGSLLLTTPGDATSTTQESRLVRLLTDGSLDPAFSAAVRGPVQVVDGGVMNPPGVRVMLRQPDGRLLIGGKFTRVNGVPRRNLARLEPDGTLDTTFDPGQGPTDLGDFSYLVNCLALLPDGRLLVAGPFQSFDGQPYRGLIRLVGDPLPRFRGTRVAGGGFETTLMAFPGAAVDLEVSGDLRQWSLWGTVTNLNGSLLWAEPASSQRFYRARNH